MTDITITCRKCAVTGIPFQYALIRNMHGPKHNKVAAFLGRLARKGAFANVENSHAIEVNRIQAFVAYCAKQGFVAA